jgi:drug/metabolite transporter (DMT)-like permease
VPRILPERWQGLDRAKGDYGAGAAREDRDLGLGHVHAVRDGAAGRLAGMSPRHRSHLWERRRKAPVSTYRRAEHDGEAARSRGEGKVGSAVPASLALATLLTGAAAIAFAPIFVKTSEVGPVATAFWRVLLALPILWAWMEIEGRRSGKPGRPSGPRDLLALFASGLFLGSTFALWHLSLELTSVATSTLLVNLAPVFVALGAWLFLGQRFGAAFLVGMAIALAGAALLVAGGTSRLGGGEVAGDGLAALAAVFYAGYFLSVSGLRPRFSTAAVMAYGAPAACAALLPVALLSGESLLPASWQGWAVLLAVALVSHVLGQSLVAYALAELPAAFSSVALLLQPTIAAALAWAILGEALGPWQAAGGAVVLAGVVLARSGSRRG